MVGVSEGELYMKAQKDVDRMAEARSRARFVEEVRQLRAGGDERVGIHKKTVRVKDSDLARQQRNHGLTIREMDRMSNHLLWVVTFYDRFANEGGVLDGKPVDINGREDKERFELIGNAVMSNSVSEVSENNSPDSWTNLAHMRTLRVKGKDAVMDAVRDCELQET